MLRGGMDRLVGGVGLRRGRRHPDRLRVGDPLDFWRVEALEPGHLLRLRAEMRLPGEAWLEWTVEPTDSGGSHAATSGPSSIPAASTAGPTGWPCRPSTAWCSDPMADRLAAVAAQGGFGSMEARI